MKQAVFLYAAGGGIIVLVEMLVTIVGLVGAVLFFGRFYVQWIVAEVKRQYVIPVAFWYMSAAGSLMLFAYAYACGSPGGTFGVCFNIIVYARNLVHIWREKRVMTPFWNAVIHVAAGAVVAVAAALTFLTWRHGYRNTTEFWMWSAIWAVGQVAFFMRFLIQWAITEIKHKSIIPASFWWLSIFGVFLHGSYFFHRLDWLLAFGTVADGLPYVRNLWLMRHCPAAEESST